MTPTQTLFAACALLALLVPSGVMADQSTSFQLLPTFPGEASRNTAASTNFQTNDAGITWHAWPAASTSFQLVHPTTVSAASSVSSQSDSGGGASGTSGEQRQPSGGRGTGARSATPGRRTAPTGTVIPGHPAAPATTAPRRTTTGSGTNMPSWIGAPAQRAATPVRSPYGPADAPSWFGAPRRIFIQRGATQGTSQPKTPPRRPSARAASLLEWAGSAGPAFLEADGVTTLVLLLALIGITSGTTAIRLHRCERREMIAAQRRRKRRHASR